LKVEFISSLEPILSDPGNPLRSAVIHLLEELEQDTITRLGSRASRLFCLRCIARYQKHKVKIPFKYKSIFFYGCRVCQRSQEFFEGKVIAILDQISTTEKQQGDDVLWVNWLIRRSLFDFDAAHILQATDEDVERFAVQVGNDTDPIRKPTYRKIQCMVSLHNVLSENSVRVLEQIFGQVEIK
jgi:hypothetical protein